MILESKILKVLFWLLGFIIAFLSCISFVEMINSYANRIENPEPFSLIGGTILSVFVYFLVGLFHVVVFMIFLYQVFNARNFNINLLIWLPTRDRWSIYVIRILGYFSIFLLMYMFLNSVDEEYSIELWEVIFYSSSIISIFMYMVWLCSWLVIEDQNR